MSFAKELAEFFQAYGGWGVAAICIIAVIYQYRDFKKVVNNKDALIQQMNTEHHKEIVAVAKECTGVLTTVNESMERCERRQEKEGS